MNNRIVNLAITGLVALLLLAVVPMAFAAPPLQDATATATVEASPVVTGTATVAPGTVATTEATVEASPAVTSTADAGATGAGAATATPAGATAPGALPATGGTLPTGATLMIALMSLSVILLGSGVMVYWLSNRRQG